MKLNKEKMAKYAALDDKALWCEICAVAEGHGYKFNTAEPSHEDMERIRAILRGEVKFSMAEALKLLNSYKSKKK